MSGPCHFVIFGAAGHLVTTKLLPSLYGLEAAGRLEEPLQFIAFARRDWDTRIWRERLRDVLSQHVGERLSPEVARRFVERFEYVRGDHTDSAAYGQLVGEISKPRPGVCENVIFYLAIRPDDFVPVVRNLDEAGLNSVIGQHRIVVEKPFGTDLQSARELNVELHRHYQETQVYRIDHYLGKETVQNLLVFRFANSVIEPLWNRHYIDHVQLTVAEDTGIGERAGYFDRSGTLRDMIQNHLLQLLTLVGMEPPASLDADALRDEKVKVLRSIRDITGEAIHDFAVRAQYAAGEVNGASVPEYRNEPGVQPGSTKETYAAIKFYIDNWRWRGVPFYLRSGKRLAAQRSMVTIRFRDPPHQLFNQTPCEDLDANWLLLAIQPEECIRFEMHAREPGLSMKPRLMQIETAYRSDQEQKLDAYATLLLDVIEGDRSLFIRFDEVEVAWRVVGPVLEHWRQTTDDLHAYPAGSWGPLETQRLFDKPYQFWRNQV